MRYTALSSRNRRRTLTWMAAMAMSVGCGSVGTADAGDAVAFEHKLKPGVLTARGDWTVSAEYSLGVATTLLSQPSGKSFRKRLDAFANTKGTLAVDPDLNSSPLTAAAGVTTFLSLYRPSIETLGPKPGEIITTQEGFDYGMATLSLQGGYETDQRFDNRNSTAGAELGYVMNDHRGIRSMIPSAFIGYDGVFVDHSKQQAIGGRKDSQRLRVFGSWKIPAGQWLAKSFDPLNVHLDIRYYLTTDASAPLRAADRDDAIYLAQALSYSFGDKPLWGFVNAAYVQVSEGRIPPATEDRTSVTFGLTVWER